MNTPKLTFTIKRHVYSDKTCTSINTIEVGKYQLSHIEGMQEFLNQDEDVTEYDEQMNHWHIQVPLASDKTKTKHHL